MNTEEMYLTILNRIDSIKADLTGLNCKMDRLETSLNGRQNEIDNRMNKLETGLNAKMNKLDDKIYNLQHDTHLELFLMGTEISVGNKSLEGEIIALSGKVDNFIYERKMKEYDKINNRLVAVEKIYQELKEKIG